MKKFKFIVNTIIFLVLLILAFQNIEPILDNFVTLRANLFFVDWQSKPIPLGLILPLGFVAGILLMFFHNFFIDRRLKKEIKNLHKELKSYQNEIDYGSQGVLPASPGNEDDPDD